MKLNFLNKKKLPILLRSCLQRLSPSPMPFLFWLRSLSKVWYSWPMNCRLLQKKILLFFNSRPIVDYFASYREVVEVLQNHENLPVFGKFERIADEVYQQLSYSLFVVENYLICQFVHYYYFRIAFLWFILVHFNYFFYHINKIEWVFSYLKKIILHFIVVQKVAQ